MDAKKMRVMVMIMILMMMNSFVFNVIHGSGVESSYALMEKYRSCGKECEEILTEITRDVDSKTSKQMECYSDFCSKLCYFPHCKRHCENRDKEKPVVPEAKQRFFNHCMDICVNVLPTWV